MLLMIRIITLKYAGKLFICNYSIIYFGPHILPKKTKQKQKQKKNNTIL